MNEVYFNVSHNGRFVMRTDRMDSFVDADRAREHLQKVFRAEDGYRISESFRPAVWTSKDITQ